MKKLTTYRKIWCLDFEFQELPGCRPHVHCVCAREIKSGQLVRIFRGGLTPGLIPFDLDPETDLVVAYYASAEIKCFKALEWPLPKNVLDLFTEVSRLTSGFLLPHGKGLLGAMSAFGLNGIAALDKESMRKLAMEKTVFTADEQAALLNYCQTDVDSLVQLLGKMESKIDLPRAQLRGHFMKAAGLIEWNGIPMDVRVANRLQGSWDLIKRTLIKKFDQHGIWQNGSFSIQAFQDFLNKRGIAWFHTDKGHLKTDDESFKTLAATHPEVRIIRELRRMLGNFNLKDISIGSEECIRQVAGLFNKDMPQNSPVPVFRILSGVPFQGDMPQWMPLKSLPYSDLGHTERKRRKQEMTMGMLSHELKNRAVLESFFDAVNYTAEMIRMAGLGKYENRNPWFRGSLSEAMEDAMAKFASKTMKNTTRHLTWISGECDFPENSQGKLARVTTHLPFGEAEWFDPRAENLMLLEKTIEAFSDHGDGENNGRLYIGVCPRCLKIFVRKRTNHVYDRSTCKTAFNKMNLKKEEREGRKEKSGKGTGPHE